MKLIEYNDKAVTISMSNDEFSKTLRILGAASTDFAKLEYEILLMNEEQLDEIAKSFYSLSKQIP